MTLTVRKLTLPITILLLARLSRENRLNSFFDQLLDDGGVLLDVRREGSEDEVQHGLTPDETDTGYFGRCVDDKSCHSRVQSDGRGISQLQ